MKKAKFINYTHYTRAEDLKRLSFILESLSKHTKPGGKVLDIGCGNGNISFQLAKYGYQVTGIDISTEAIEEAKRNYKLPNLTFKTVKAEDLATFNDTRFDALVCSEVIEHLNHPEDLTQLFKNYLNPGGAVIVTVPNGFGPREVLITKRMQNLIRKKGFTFKVVLGLKKMMGYKGETIQSSAEDLTHVQFFSKKSLKNLAESSGFEIEDVRAANFVENVFPFSLFARYSLVLQKLDCWIADRLPVTFSSGFLTVWKPR
ncbi:MAG: methyltransferase domain-containing protein [Bacteroidales bacterium]|nr:methyltransferase domain-containing protein [Bacteroidales bacterium]